MRSLDLKAVRYFVAISESGSFSGAAQALGVAQSWLSTRIHQLEEECGFRLFDRSLRKVALTDEGRSLLPPAQDALASWEKLDRTFESVVRESVLSIGIPDSYPSGFRSRLINCLIDLDVSRFDVQTCDRDQLLSGLESSRFDLIVIDRLVDDGTSPGWTDEEVNYATHIRLLVPESHPLARDEIISIGLLSQSGIAIPRFSRSGSPNSLLDYLEQNNVNVTICPDKDLAVTQEFALRLMLPTIIGANVPIYVPGLVERAFPQPFELQVLTLWRKGDFRAQIKNTRRIIRQLFSRE
jgi:DNA-binding transcriptional LysR family regulator